MDPLSNVTRSDLNVLLRIVGSRNGADFDALSDFVGAHARQVSGDQLRESLDRLVAASLIVQRDKVYFGTPELQAAFLDECRNCRDTIEEFDILTRIMSQVARSDPEAKDQADQPKNKPVEFKARWRDL